MGTAVDRIRVFLLLVWVFLALAALLAWESYSWLKRWGEREHNLPAAVQIDLEKGLSLKPFSVRLEARGVVADARLFEAWVRLFSDYSRFKAGHYRFVHSVSPASIAARITRGDVFEPVVVRIVVPEGFTQVQIVERAVAAGIGSREEFNEILEDEELRSKLKIPADTFEGFLYPATYPYVRMPTPAELITDMVEAFWKHLPEGYQKAIETKDLSLADAVVFASLIERETKIEEEKPKVAEVIWRRLKIGRPLGIDASIIYGLKDKYRGNLTRRHLDDRGNRYNTRVYRGLPPTAIGSPSRSSLEAILNPTNFGYLYYVVDPDLDGGHHFSKTLNEHNRYVRKLVQSRRRKR